MDQSGSAAVRARGRLPPVEGMYAGPIFAGWQSKGCPGNPLGDTAPPPLGVRRRRSCGRSHNPVKYSVAVLTCVIVVLQVALGDGNLYEEVKKVCCHNGTIPATSCSEFASPESDTCVSPQTPCHVVEKNPAGLTGCNALYLGYVMREDSIFDTACNAGTCTPYQRFAYVRVSGSRVEMQDGCEYEADKFYKRLCPHWCKGEDGRPSQCVREEEHCGAHRLADACDSQLSGYSGSMDFNMIYADTKIANNSCDCDSVFCSPEVTVVTPNGDHKTEASRCRIIGERSDDLDGYDYCRTLCHRYSHADTAFQDPVTMETFEACRKYRDDTPRWFYCLQNIINTAGCDWGCGWSSSGGVNRPRAVTLMTTISLLVML
eukprot:GHVU01148868.1.p1 GENE.GHVU01148868.1~~GHVU01148868.1.p1  ORF type:complete len:374 (+),score=18.70 GHVU01148868.1:264-1385(+)